ncbi:flagellar export chaperone FliS [Butyrivibrio fibrisolvens]|uniref:flagellar export chaperone FliS n=1 Tax=Butyrivibrio fibrisolvens TaxID=831 RepID=UPI00200A0FB2|nr:flagellar export chaperone FliS [Butyrivibrio fibrisolvens]
MRLKMALTNPYSQYANNKIMSASGPELTLMLYEGAIKFCNRAESAIEKKDIETAHNNIKKVQNIISYLRETLNMKYSTAKDFENIYVYLTRRLVEANMHKDIEVLQEVNKHLHSVRDTWIEVMKANNIPIPNQYMNKSGNN